MNSTTRTLWRRPAAFALFAVLAISAGGCSRPESLADIDAARLVAQGLAAFRDGDRASVVAAEDALRSRYPAPNPFANPCSWQDLQQRRQAAFSDLLTTLRDAPPQLDEFGRYVRVQHLLVGGDDGPSINLSGAPVNDSTCASTPAKPVLLVIDGVARGGVFKTLVPLLSDWRDDLDRRFGHDQVQARLDVQGAARAAIQLAHHSQNP